GRAGAPPQRAAAQPGWRALQSAGPRPGEADRDESARERPVHDSPFPSRDGGSPGRPDEGGHSAGPEEIDPARSGSAGRWPRCRRGRAHGDVRPMIEVIHFTKHYGEFIAVDDLSFTIGKGETFGFIGPNGAGKSTTIRFLATLLRPTSGEGRVA